MEKSSSCLGDSSVVEVKRVEFAQATLSWYGDTGSLSCAKRCDRSLAAGTGDVESGSAIEAGRSVGGVDSRADNDLESMDSRAALELAGGWLIGRGCAS